MEAAEDSQEQVSELRGIKLYVFHMLLTYQIKSYPSSSIILFMLFFSAELLLIRMHPLSGVKANHYSWLPRFIAVLHVYTLHYSQ